MKGPIKIYGMIHGLESLDQAEKKLIKIGFQSIDSPFLFPLPRLLIGGTSRLLLGLIFIAFLQSCERRTVVHIEGGNPPVFALSGSGRLGEVIIFGPEQEAKAVSNPFDDTHALWRITAESKGENTARPVEQLASITYGVVPQGYKQIKPETGQPPQLVPGKRYRYWFVTVSAPHASGYFEIQGDRAVPLHGP